MGCGVARVVAGAVGDGVGVGEGVGVVCKAGDWPAAPPARLATKHPVAAAAKSNALRPFMNPAIPARFHYITTAAEPQPYLRKLPFVRLPYLQPAGLQRVRT